MQHPYYFIQAFIALKRDHLIPVADLITCKGKYTSKLIRKWAIRLKNRTNDIINSFSQLPAGRDFTTKLDLKNACLINHKTVFGTQYPAFWVGAVIERFYFCRCFVGHFVSSITEIVKSCDPFFQILFPRSINFCLSLSITLAKMLQASSPLPSP